MKKNRVFLLPLLLFVMLLGCEEFFEYNLFAALDVREEIEIAELEQMEQQDALDLLDEEFDSDIFMETLEEDKIEEIETFLSDIIFEETGGELKEPPVDDPEALADYQQAALLYAEVNIATTDGDEFSNNIFGLLEVLQDSDGDSNNIAMESGGDANDFKEIFEILIPEEVDTIEEFTSMIEGLQDASAGYEAFGNSLVDENLDGDISQEELPENVVIGEVLQNAACATVVDVFIEAIEADGSEDPVGDLYSWIFEGEELPLSQEGMASPLESLAENQAIENILDAANLESLFGMGENTDSNTPDVKKKSAKAQRR